MAKLPLLPYEVSPRSVKCLWWMGASAAALRLRGGKVPRLPGRDADELAAESVRRNAHEVLWAGSGHFRYMWVSDFGKAFRGAAQVLPAAYLRGQLSLMIEASSKAGHVTSCFDARGGFDMPYPRADGLPWLIFALFEYEKLTGDESLRRESRGALQALLDGFERDQLEDGLVSPRLTGDWMDTVLRPSSTYNNVCVAAMLSRARALGFATAQEPEAFAARLLERRLRGGALVDYHGAGRESVDAPVYALYLEVFDRALREKLADRLEAGGFTQPYPIASAAKPYEARLLPPLTRWLTPGYHSAIWLHLGCMYLNGLRALGRDVEAQRSRLAGLIMRHGNVVEALDASGELYRAPAHVTEHGLTMAAGQWLELSSARTPRTPASR